MHFSHTRVVSMVSRFSALNLFVSYLLAFLTFLGAAATKTGAQESLDYESQRLLN